MNQNVATDDGVKLAVGLPVMNVRLDAFDVVDMFGRRPGFERFQCGRIDVHRRHAATAADRPRSEQRDVANAATDIEHAHARRNSGAAKELFGERIQYRGLQKQAAPFPVVMPHHIRVRVSHGLSLTYSLRRPPSGL